MKLRQVFGIFGLVLSLVSCMGRPGGSSDPAANDGVASRAQTLALEFGRRGVPVLTEDSTRPGVQIVPVLAFGGYWPLSPKAKAGVPTVLRLYTARTFDCSRALILPSLNRQEILPESGFVDFDLGTPAPGSRFSGLCSMAMYFFSIDFE